MIRKKNSANVTSASVFIFTLLMIIMTGSLSACSLRSDNKKSTQPASVDITLNAAKNINPNEKDEASPLRVVVYQLTQQQAFMSSDYITLMENKDPELNKQASVIYDTIILPGEKKTLQLDLADNVTAVGIISAYRNISDSDWKSTWDVPTTSGQGWFSRHFFAEQPRQLHLDVSLDKLTTSVKAVNEL